MLTPAERSAKALDTFMFAVMAHGVDPRALRNTMQQLLDNESISHPANERGMIMCDMGLSYDRVKNLKDWKLKRFGANYIKPKNK